MMLDTLNNANVIQMTRLPALALISAADIVAIIRRSELAAKK